MCLMLQHVKGEAQFSPSIAFNLTQERNSLMAESVEDISHSMV